VACTDWYVLSQFSLISKSSIRITRETSIIIQKIEGFGGGPLLVGGLGPALPPKSGPGTLAVHATGLLGCTRTMIVNTIQLSCLIVDL